MWHAIMVTAIYGDPRCGRGDSMPGMDGENRVVGWWARGDLNPGPPPCQGGVLTRLDDGPSPPRLEGSVYLSPPPLLGLFLFHAFPLGRLLIGVA